MKAEMITAVKNSIVNTISPKKAEKTAAVAIKDGEKMISNGQDAAAAQGKAMLKPYKKPEMKVMEMEDENLAAASPTNGGYTPDGGHGNLDEEPDCARNVSSSFDIWE